MVSPKGSKAVNTVGGLTTTPPPLLGPLEDIFQVLQELFHSKKPLALSKGVVRALFTIYQNLKVIRVHAIVQCQFANDLKIHLVDLKRQLEAARSNDSSKAASATAATAAVSSTMDVQMTSTPEPRLKTVFPVLAQTEKVVNTLHQFLVGKPRLRLSLPSGMDTLIERMPDDLRCFPDHLARQLGECKTSLQRIVVLYNQLAEAHKSAIVVEAPLPTSTVHGYPDNGQGIHKTRVQASRQDDEYK